MRIILKSIILQTYVPATFRLFRVILALIIFSDLRLSLTANGSLLKSSPINATSAVSIAVPVPAPPITIPTVEAANAGASLTPSLTIATLPSIILEVLDSLRIYLPLIMIRS